MGKQQFFVGDLKLNRNISSKKYNEVRKLGTNISPDTCQLAAVTF